MTWVGRTGERRGDSTWALVLTLAFAVAIASLGWAAWRAYGWRV